MFTQLACSRTHRFRNLTFTQYIGIMAVRRNKIPRLLIGAGGVHLYDLPGVTYPPEILKNTEKPPEKKPRLEPCLFLSHPPRWGMPTAEVARQLGCSEGAARMRLRRFNVEHCYVRNKSGRICAYWRREQVKNLLQSVNKVVEFMPNCYISATAATHLLQISRCTLTRYECRYNLHPMRILFRSGSYKCIRTFYLRSEIMHLMRVLHHLS